jgi:branched-subunit amino acid transport protein
VTALTAMLTLALVCWVFRILLIVIVPAQRLPRRALEGLRHLAPAVLAALVAVETDAAGRGDDLRTAGLVLGTVVLIMLAVRLTGSLLLAIAIGLGAALLLDLVVLV